MGSMKFSKDVGRYIDPSEYTYWSELGEILPQHVIKIEEKDGRIHNVGKVLVTPSTEEAITSQNTAQKY